MATRTAPRIPRYQIGQTGSAGDVEGLPALVLAQQPDAVIDAGTIGPITIRAASVRGAGHRYEGSPRQDDLCLATAGPNGEWLIAIVADGVSAGPRSHVAARVAVRVGVSLVGQALATMPPSEIDWDELIGTLAGHVLLQARKDAGDETLDAHGASKLMATTAAIVIVPLDSNADGSRPCTVLPIGDTSVWVLQTDGIWRSVTHIKNDGEAVASSATFALPLLPSDSIRPTSTLLTEGEALFVVTDGVGDPLGGGLGEVGDALATVWATPPNRFEFAAQVDFNRRSHTDDRTVIGMWPDRGDGPEAQAELVDVDDEVPDWINLSPTEPPPTSGPAASTPARPATPAAPAPTSVPAPPPVPPALPDPVIPEPDPLPAPSPSTWEPTPWEPTPWQPGTGDSNG